MVDIYKYDETLLECINLTNVFSYAVKNDISVLIGYMLDREITYETVDFYCNVLEAITAEIERKDFDLQYDSTSVEDGSITARQQDTIITFGVLDAVEQVGMRDLERFSIEQKAQLLHNAQQATVIGMKFQVRYALETISALRSEELIWKMLGIS